MLITYVSYFIEIRQMNNLSGSQLRLIRDILSMSHSWYCHWRYSILFKLNWITISILWNTWAKKQHKSSGIILWIICDVLHHLWVPIENPFTQWKPDSLKITFGNFEPLYSWSNFRCKHTQCETAAVYLLLHEVLQLLQKALSLMDLPEYDIST